MVTARHTSARELVDRIADPGSWTSWDTPAVEPTGIDAAYLDALVAARERSGVDEEVARCLADLVALRAPTVCVLLGQGAGGGALALLPTDRVLSAQHGWLSSLLSSLPPEGASVILHGTTACAAQVAARQGVRSLDLLACGIVDRIVAEHPDAADEPEDFVRRLGQALQHELVELVRRDPEERLAARDARYRTVGTACG